MRLFSLPETLSERRGARGVPGQRPLENTGG
jgi:hypothetical protein